MKHHRGLNSKKLKRGNLIVSEKRKFIYIRLGKVAGTSIHTHVLKKEVPDLIFTPEKEWVKTFKREDYFVFTFVRNPWDRMVSIWNYHSGGAHLPTFKKFIRSDFKYNSHSGKPKIGIYNHTLQMVDHFFIEPDYVGRFENLKDDWKHVGRKIGVSQELEHHNETPYKGKIKQHYTTYYDVEDVETIRKLFKDDIETFNYKFGEN